MTHTTQYPIKLTVLLDFDGAEALPDRVFKHSECSLEAACCIPGAGILIYARGIAEKMVNGKLIIGEPIPYLKELIDITVFTEKGRVHYSFNLRRIKHEIADIVEKEPEKAELMQSICDKVLEMGDIICRSAVDSELLNSYPIEFRQAVPF